MIVLAKRYLDIKNVVFKGFYSVSHLWSCTLYDKLPQQQIIVHCVVILVSIITSHNNISTGNDQRGQVNQSSIDTDAEPFISSVNNDLENKTGMIQSFLSYMRQTQFYIVIIPHSKSLYNLILGPGQLNELGSYLTTHTSLSQIRREFAPSFVNYKKRVHSTHSLK